MLLDTELFLCCINICSCLIWHYKDWKIWDDGIFSFYVGSGYFISFTRSHFVTLTPHVWKIVFYLLFNLILLFLLYFYLYTNSFVVDILWTFWLAEELCLILRLENVIIIDITYYRIWQLLRFNLYSWSQCRSTGLYIFVLFCDKWLNC